ncbi:hypothetical protein ABPG74_004745 [Tetrahymena malaccensis]
MSASYYEEANNSEDIFFEEISQPLVKSKSEQLDISLQINEINQMDHEQLASEYCKCNKSNIIKNLLRQFHDFIQIKGDQVVIESIYDIQYLEKNIAQVRKEYHNFSKNKLFNQSFLLSILKSKRFSYLFQYFLKYYIFDWIHCGNIKNIRSHLICISFIQKCFSNQQLLDKIVIYKKRN